MAIINVAAGQDLQAAIDSSIPGDVIQMESGSTFLGQFDLPTRSLGTTSTLRGLGSVIRSNGTSQPGLRTNPGAHGWLLQGFEVQSSGVSDVLRLGSATQSSNEIPRRIVLDGLTIRGDEIAGSHRGIAANAAELHIKDCKILDCHAPNLETQGICAWNTPGPLLVEGCHIEAGSIGILIGGEQPSIPNLTPSRLTFRRNKVTRPISWRSQPYACKNLFELKHAQEVIVEDNIFENNWLQGQSGFAIVFTPRASGPNSPWTTVAHVRFRHNTIAHSGCGVNMLGKDTNNVSKAMYDIVVEDNDFIDINGSRWGGAGTFLQLVDEPHGPRVSRNRVDNSGSAIFVDSNNTVGRRDFVHRLVFERNVCLGGMIRGNGTSSATTTIQTYLPDSHIEGNILGGESNLAGNRCLSSSALKASLMYEPESGRLIIPPSWESLL